MLINYVQLLKITTNYYHNSLGEPFLNGVIPNIHFTAKVKLNAKQLVSTGLRLYSALCCNLEFCDLHSADISLVDITYIYILRHHVNQTHAVSMMAYMHTYV